MNHKPLVSENEGPTSAGNSTPATTTAINTAAAASTSASTTQSTATKQILNSLILDFLQKQQLVETAKVFTREIPNLSNVPPTMDCPQGFLFEWWLIFRFIQS